MSGTNKTRDPGVYVLVRPIEKTPGEHKSRRTRKPHVLTILFSIFLLVALLHFIAVTHSAEPTVVPVNCTGLLRETDYTQVVHLRPQAQTMGAVQMINQLVGGQPAALVSVNDNNAQHTLSVYVFGCTMQQHTPKLTTLFTQYGLAQGTVEVSNGNTLVLSALDTSLSPQQMALVQPLQQNIYREFRWQHGAFVQVSFPGFYPVVSRSEAEQLQQQANSGQPVSWTSPLSTAEQMARDLLHWMSSSTQDIVTSNDGITAQVTLYRQSPTMTLNVTLSRLIQHNSGGLWFVTAAQTSNLVVSHAPLITPPFTITGSGALSDGQTTISLFDHTLSPLTTGNSGILPVDASGNFSASYMYTNNQPGQSGVLLVQSLPPNGSSETGQVYLSSIIIG